MKYITLLKTGVQQYTAHTHYNRYRRLISEKDEKRELKKKSKPSHQGCTAI